MSNWYFNFPEIILPEGHTVSAQVDKVREEVDEATAEIIFDRRKLAIQECVDIILTAETLYRVLVSKVGQEEVDEAVKFVMEKNNQRGYFA